MEDDFAHDYFEWPAPPITSEEILRSREEYDRFVSELFAACTNGDETHATDILDDPKAVESQITANCYDNDDTTPLQVAAANGHVPVIDLLLSRGADPLLCNHFGWTPLMHAAFHGHAEAVEALIKAGVNVNSRSFLENCPLKLAAREGHAKVVTILLDHGCMVESNTCAVSTEYNLTPLMIAAVYKQDEIVRILLERGADVNAAMRPTGMSVLMLGVLFGELTTVQLLLKHKADPKLTNVVGETAYALAEMEDRRDIMALLEPLTRSMNLTSGSRGTGGKISTLMDAIHEGSKSHVESILRTDPSKVNHVEKENGSSPLIIASMLGHVEIAAVLVEHGAKIDHQDTKSGWTALMQAIYHGKANVAKYLIHQGADIGLRSHEGHTAFDLATILQAPDEGGILPLLAYRIAEQNVVKTHKSRHFLAFLFRGNRTNQSSNGSDSRRLTNPVKPMNWWRKFKSRFRRGVTTVRRSASVANVHSIARQRSSLSGNEMNGLGEMSRTLKKDNLFYSCDDLLRVQTLRRSSLDSSTIHRVNSPKLAAPHSPRTPNKITTTNGSTSTNIPIPPFRSPTYLTTDAAKPKVSSPANVSSDFEKRATIPTAQSPMIASSNSTLVGGTSTSTLMSAHSSVITAIVRNPTANGGVDTSSMDKPHHQGSPPDKIQSKTDRVQSVGEGESEFSNSSNNDEQSVASMNAARLGVGRMTPQRVPAPRKPSNTLPLIPLPKKASSACDLALPLRRTNTPNLPSASTSSSGSTANNAGGNCPPPNMLGPNYRMKRPQALYIVSNNASGAGFVGGGRKPRGVSGNRVIHRPHSYHDAIVESGVAAAYGMAPYQNIGRKKIGIPPPLNIGRPCSYQEPMVVANSLQALNDLPITPTRRSFNFFASDLPSSSFQCSSTPQLTASLSNSSGRSSVVTPIRRPSYAVSPTNFIGVPMFFPNITRDGNDHLQHTLWQLGLEKYANVFREQEVDMETFLTLTDSDLMDIGIMDAANRSEILVVVRTLNFCFQNQRRHMNDVREVHNEREDEAVV